MKTVNIFIVTAAYIILSLLIGKFHPFEPYNMYNGFPNHAFFLTIKDEKGNMIPMYDIDVDSRQSNLFGGGMVHVYNTYCEQENLPCWSNERFHKGYKELGQFIFDQHKNSIDIKKIQAFDSLIITRTNIWMEDNKIVEDEYTIFAISTQEISQ